MEGILDIIIRLIAGVLGVFVIYGINKVIALIKGKISAADAEKLDELISIFVAAAEQMYKKSDISGETRLKYVEELLVQAGYEITEELRARIEEAVYNINLFNKG